MSRRLPEQAVSSNEAITLSTSHQHQQQQTIYYEATQNTISETQSATAYYEASELQIARASTQNAIVSVQESTEFTKIDWLRFPQTASLVFFFVFFFPSSFLLYNYIYKQSLLEISRIFASIVYVFSWKYMFNRTFLMLQMTKIKTNFSFVFPRIYCICIHVSDACLKNIKFMRNWTTHCDRKY